MLKNFFLLFSKSNIQIASLGSFLFINALASFIVGILIVQIFGITKEIEIFFAANLIILTIDRLFTLGTLNEIILPKYVSLKESHSQDVAMQYLSIFLNIFLLASLIIIIILWFSSTLLLSTILVGFSEKEIFKTSELFKILLIFLPIKIFNGISAIPFRANQKYNIHERSGFLNRIVLILLLLTFNDNYGVEIIVLGTVLGICLRFIYIVFLYKKFNFKYFFIFKTNEFNPSDIIKKIRVPFLDTFAFIINWWIMLAGLTMMSGGIFAIYQYVQQLYGNFFSIIMVSLGSIFLTEISSKENLLNKKIIEDYLMKISFISFFIFPLAIIGGYEFLSIIWSSDKFQESDIFIAYILLAISFSTLLMSMTENIYQKINIARGDADIQMIGKFVIIVSTSILFLVFVEKYGLNALIIVAIFKGIALLFYSIFLCRLKNSQYFYTFNLTHIFKCILMSAATILTVYFLIDVLLALIINNIYLDLLLKMILGIMLFLILNKLLNIFEIKSILSN